MAKIKAQQTTETADEFAKRLRKMGYRCIGTGAFAAVYARPGDDVVIKIGLHGEEDPWLHYAYAVKSSKQNPWLPKINKVGLFRKKDSDGYPEDYYVAEIERLKPITIGRKRSHREVLEGLDSVWDIVERSSLKAMRLFGLDDNLIEAFRVITKVQDRTNSSRDIHSGNVMLRGDQFVITDPLCG